VFPAEVEDMLARHEKIQEAAAVGVEDEKFGQRLKAFVVLEDGAELSEDDIKKYIKENLANYKVPREVVFIDELPRNQTGKVLKKKLLEETDEEDEPGEDKDQKKAKSSKSSGQNGKREKERERETESAT
jgi:fatty-acyl-CoA synthase